MQTNDFYFDLPECLIARYPLKERTQSRLLHLSKSTGYIQHHQFTDIKDFLKPNDLLIFNNTKVIPARLFGKKETGGHIELLVERILTSDTVLAHVKSNRSPKLNSKLIIDDKFHVLVEKRIDDLYQLKFLEVSSVLELLYQIGHIPLPHYLERMDEAVDKTRYQTVYAKEEGAVAAPTAGLHFDEKYIEQLNTLGIESDYITLHVGAGTFQPVRVTDIHDHQMHSEWIDVSATVCEKIRKTKDRGRRVIAVGTTVVRSLETAASSGSIQPYRGETDIFIYPGYQFKCVDAILTNFHLPESTLLMLVCAFAGRMNVLSAYQEAIKEKYRFFSYGDAMFLS